jgi:hypothetical protein
MALDFIQNAGCGKPLRGSIELPGIEYFDAQMTKPFWRIRIFEQHQFQWRLLNCKICVTWPPFMQFGIEQLRIVAHGFVQIIYV